MLDLCSVNYWGILRVLLMGFTLSLCASASFSQMLDGMIVMDESLENLTEQEQRKIALNTANEQQQYGLLHHAFFENDVFEIYNYTAYDTGAAQNKLLLGNAEHIGWQDFGISFGYGVKLNLNSRHSIGYEYLSNFPYDRGQIIRFFWTAVF